MNIAVLLLLTAFGGLFAMSEIGIVSARRTRLQHWANEGNHAAQAALALADHPLAFLSTVQIAITVIGILSGIFGEARLVGDVTGWLSHVPGLVAHRETVARVIVVVGVTFASLVVGELAPKRFALHNAERVACAVAQPMDLLSRLCWPLVRVLSVCTDLLLRLLGVRPTSAAAVTEEEVTVLIEQAAQAGVFTPAEEEVLKSAVQLGDREVATLMTPRTEAIWLDLDEPSASLAQQVVSSHHSVFPVARGNLDDLAGVVHAKDILAQLVTGEPLEVAALVRKPPIVPESTRAMRLLEELRSERMHLAIVIDEYGGVAGLVTLEDILEAVLGDMPTAGQPDDPRAVQREDGSWLVDGLLPAEEFKALFDLGELPDEEDYVTLAGLVLHLLGHVPAPAESVDWAGWRFEVMDMDGRRIDKVLVQRTPESAT